MRFTKKITLSLLICLCLAVSSYPQDKKIIYTEDNNEQIHISLQNVQIDDFIKMVAKVINKNILISRKIPGTVNFISNTPIFKDEILNILISVLYSRGYTITKDRGFYKIVRSSEAVRFNLPIVSKSKTLMHTVFLEFKNSKVDAIAAKLRLFASRYGKIITIKETNSMIISDFPENVKHIRKIAYSIDQKAKLGLEAEFISLTNAKASSIIGDLIKIAKTTINQTGNDNKIEILKDDGTNSIIIIGNNKNRKKIKEIIAKFDTKNSQEIKTKIFPLENSEAKSVLNTLTKIISKQKSKSVIKQAMVSSNEEMNAIIVSAVEDDMKNISKIIKSLDIEKPQVYVKAKIVEVSQNNSKKIGIKYGLEGGKASSSGLYSFLINSGGSSIALSTQVSGIIDTGKISEGLALGAMIDFLTEEGAATILSEPSLLCVNNKESFIYVGQTRSILTSTAKGASTTDLARNTYTRKDIGLTLKIKPRLSAGNMVTLSVQTTLEDVVGGSGVGLPITTKRDVKTSAIVKSGESVIIGGLIKDKMSKTVSKVPLLGDIPLFGRIFRDTGNIHDKINLVIMLTPYIVKKPTDFQKLRIKLLKLNELQNRYKMEMIKKIKERNKK